MSTTNDGGSPPSLVPFPPRRTPGGFSFPPLAGILPILILGAAVFGGIFYWTFCRIEPGADEIAILIHKTGKDLPPDQIIATTAATTIRMGRGETPELA